MASVDVLLLQPCPACCCVGEVAEDRVGLFAESQWPRLSRLGFILEVREQPAGSFALVSG